MARQGLVFACYFDRDAIALILRCFWIGPGAELVLRGFDRDDEPVGAATFNLQATGVVQSFTLQAVRPMRRMTATVVRGKLDRPLPDPDIEGASRFAALELERLTFVAVDDWIREATGAEGCREGDDSFTRQYEGRGQRVLPAEPRIRGDDPHPSLDRPSPSRRGGGRARGAYLLRHQGSARPERR